MAENEFSSQQKIMQMTLLMPRQKVHLPMINLVDCLSKSICLPFQTAQLISPVVSSSSKIFINRVLLHFSLNVNTLFISLGQ